MTYRHSTPALLALLALLLCCTAGKSPADNRSQAPGNNFSSPKTGSSFYVGNWNVENLFDTRDDPKNKYDNEFLPGNVTTRWTRVRLETKLENLGRVIQSMNHGKGPDILGLEEVEHEHLVEQLLEKINGKSYGIAYAESRDRRGIDTALIFNRRLFTLENSRTYTVPLRYGGRTRDILHAELKDRRGETLHVFVNHWPSRGGGTESSDSKRFTAARTLSKAISRIFKDDPKAHVIVLGDFNDEPSDRSLSGILRVNPYPSKNGYQPDKLYNLTSKKSAKGQGTFFHSYQGRIEWRMYDQIIVSGTLLNNATIDYDKGSMEIAGPSFMLSHKGWRKGAPFSTFGGGDRYLGGYSDHLPIGARFNYPQDGSQSSKSEKSAKNSQSEAKKPKKSDKNAKNHSKSSENGQNQSKSAEKVQKSDSKSQKQTPEPPETDPEKVFIYF